MDSNAPIGAQLTSGSLLAGRYRLVSPIATGGMAQVWRAEDTVLGRHVAAKVLHPHLATDQAFLLRFQREAIAAARLSHRSIVQIFDTVSDSGTEAIIMELLEGRTMRAVLDESGPLPVRDIIDIGVQISEALTEAHRGGVVHRDVKPSNILLCPDRRVMVTDFGIAKAGEDTDLTVTGTLLGTAKYLSPNRSWATTSTRAPICTRWASCSTKPLPGAPRFELRPMPQPHWPDSIKRPDRCRDIEPTSRRSSSRSSNA